MSVVVEVEVMEIQFATNSFPSCLEVTHSAPVHMTYNVVSTVFDSPVISSLVQVCFALEQGFSCPRHELMNSLYSRFGPVESDYSRFPIVECDIRPFEIKDFLFACSMLNCEEYG